MTATRLELCERYRLSAGTAEAGDGGFAVGAALPAEVAAALGACLPGWRLGSLAGASPRALPEITVEPVEAGYRVRYALLPGGCYAAGSPIEAANAVAGAATGAWVGARPGWVQLHAASVELGAGLTLLLGASGAGKSTLALECAAAGHRLFGDDRLALAPAPEGVALGVGPKLRRPLPEAVSPALRRLAAERTLCDTGSVAFLGLPPALLAAPGTRAAVARLVLLERAAGGRQGLEPVETAAVLRALLPNALAPRLGPAELVAWSRRLVERLPCRRLRYRDAAAARALLEEAP